MHLNVLRQFIIEPHTEETRRMHNERRIFKMAFWHMEGPILYLWISELILKGLGFSLIGTAESLMNNEFLILNAIHHI